MGLRWVPDIGFRTPLRIINTKTPSAGWQCPETKLHVKISPDDVFLPQPLKVIIATFRTDLNSVFVVVVVVGNEFIGSFCVDSRGHKPQHFLFYRSDVFITLSLHSDLDNFYAEAN